MVRRVIAEGKNVTDVAENELHRFRAWAYKWLKRYDIDGLNGLKKEYEDFVILYFTLVLLLP